MSEPLCIDNNLINSNIKYSYVNFKVSILAIIRDFTTKKLNKNIIKIKKN